MGLFDGFDKEVVGPWKPGRYDGVIVAEYETSGSFAAIHRTEDKATTNQTTGEVSRNLKICVTVVDGGKTKSLNYTINYRPNILDPKRVAEIRELRAKKVQMAGADFRDNMSMTKIHELEKAGYVLSANSHGFDADKLVAQGHAASFYLAVHQMIEGSRDSKTIKAKELEEASDEDKAKFFNKITSVNPTK